MAQSRNPRRRHARNNGMTHYYEGNPRPMQEDATGSFITVHPYLSTFLALVALSTVAAIAGVR